MSDARRKTRFQGDMMVRPRFILALLGVAAVGITAAALQGPAAHGECPAGQTETRPGNCQAPSQPPPSIVDYRPRSTLVTAAHPVPKAKFPAIDIHGHPPSLASSAANVVAALDALNVRVLVSANNTSGDGLQRTVASLASGPYKERFRILTGIDFRNVGPGWADKAVKQLEADV